MKPAPRRARSPTSPTELELGLVAVDRGRVRRARRGADRAQAVAVPRANAGAGRVLGGKANPVLADPRARQRRIVLAIEARDADPEIMHRKRTARAGSGGGVRRAGRARFGSAGAGPHGAPAAGHSPGHDQRSRASNTVKPHHASPSPHARLLLLRASAAPARSALNLARSMSPPLAFGSTTPTSLARLRAPAFLTRRALMGRGRRQTADSDSAPRSRDRSQPRTRRRS